MKIGETNFVQAGAEFAEIKWREVADIMDATILETTPKKVVMALKNAIYHFHDNGGEINITKEVAVRNYSVPYTDIDGKTLGYRLITAIEGKRIDYKFRV
jgi:hypothetical protein